MKNRKLKKILLILIVLPTLIFAQNDNYWTPIDSNTLDQKDIVKSKTIIENFDVYNLNIDVFKSKILQAPFRFQEMHSDVLLTFPIGKDTYQTFKIYKAQTMSDELASKFPSITSYVGISRDKKNSIRLTLTDQGLFGVASTKKGSLYINPYTRSGNEYQVYFRSDSKSVSNFECFYEEEIKKENLISNITTSSTLADVDDSKLRNYRLAVATTGEYSQFHITQSGNNGSTTAQQIQAVMNAIVVTIDRVNEVFENDISATFTIVGNNDDLIYLNANTDPFSNFNDRALISQSQTTINNIIGNSNYDIGHTFSTGGGGLAQLFSLCSSGSKARGITGQSQPIGDPYAIDFVAHEIGHQFGANHTFNNCGSTNLSATSVEPGSGSTIMAYAGICSGVNVQSNSDPYFHAVSIDEMYNYISNINGCAQETNLSNVAPIISPTPDYTIPKGTAFELTANATDANGDNLTYCWEQIDNQSTSAPPSSFSTQGAVFRSINPTESSTRSFPNMESVFNGDLSPTWEVVSIVSREYNFAVTVRDNNIMGGQNSRDDMVVDVSTAGPFVVTSQNTGGIQYNQNETINITWNVAGTTGNGINCTLVNIYITFDDGETLNLIGNNVPNTGSANVNTPIGIPSNNARIKIKGVDNVFYAVNSTPFTITNTLSTNPIELSQLYSVYPNPNNGNFTINFNEASGADYSAKVYDLRGRLISNTMISTSESLTKNIDLNQPQSGIYILKVSNGSQESVKKLIIE